MADTVIPRRASAALPWAPLIFIGFWSWAIWACAEHWRGNPNYSYGWAVPLLAFGFGLRRYFVGPAQGSPSSYGETTISPAASIVLSAAVGGIVFVLEFARQQMWHPQVVLMTICFLTIAVSFGIFWFAGGRALVRTQLFPVLFFLTAVPWPARLEQPVTSTLMRWVVAATAELLHWLGIEAQTSGGAIALRSGMVGITEACSGIRSLQAGIMFGLALGEWFLLRPGRRVVLLTIAVGCALLSNLARTVALSLQAERHGVASVEEVHDLIGNVTITALIVAIWLAGKLLVPRAAQSGPASFGELAERVRNFGRAFFTKARPGFVSLGAACLVGLVAARCLYAAVESRDQTQVSPFFSARADESGRDKFIPVPKDIWNELRPTSGEYIRRQDDDLPRGVADFYHFFWKPSPWNRFALVHRPDICMPGVGWESTGLPDALDVDFDGRKVRFYAFRFRRGDYHALQMWGVWRNGEPISLDYQPAQVLGDALPPPSLHLEGKRRSATEIVACSLFSEESVPPAEMAVALLRSVFQFRPQ